MNILAPTKLDCGPSSCSRAVSRTGVDGRRKRSRRRRRRRRRQRRASPGQAATSKQNDQCLFHGDKRISSARTLALMRAHSPGCCAALPRSPSKRTPASLRKSITSPCLAKPMLVGLLRATSSALSFRPHPPLLGWKQHSNLCLHGRVVKHILLPWGGGGCQVRTAQFRAMLGEAENRIENTCMFVYVRSRSKLGQGTDTKTTEHT